MTAFIDKLRKINSAGFEGTPLAPGSRFNPIKYEERVIAALRPKCVLDRIASFSFVDNVHCGAPRARITEPQGYAQPYEEDGQAKIQDFEYGCETYMDIEYGFMTMRKMSKEQRDKFLCNDPKYMEMLLNADSIEGRLLLEKAALHYMVGEVSGYNQGLSAGVSSHSYDMGSPVNGIPFSGDSFEELIQNSKLIFNEWNIETEEGGMGRPFLLIHPFMEKYIFQNERLTSYYHMGSCVACPRVTGAIPTPIYGFDVIKTPCLPVAEVDGKIMYPILAGFRDATEVVAEFEQVDRDYPFVGDRSYIYEKWWDFGMKVWDPRKLALAWGYIE